MSQTSHALAESIPPTVEENISQRIDRLKDESFWNLSIENDLFGGGTDQYYTSGVRLSYFDVNTTVPVFIDKIAEAFPTFDVNETTSTYFSIGQNIFTPDNIEVSSLQQDDRPYAGFLYGSIGLASIENNHIDDFELSLGIVGPAAFGEETQKFIHENISNSPEPLGWDNQLENEPGLILSYGRRWPVFYQKNWPDYSFRLEPNVGFSLGNIYTYANTGMSIVFAPHRSRYQDTPPRVRPAIPGTGFFDTPDEKFSWFLFGGIDGRAIARNIFLDGNTFVDSHSVDKKHFVADANAGFAISYDDFRLSYTVNYRTKEFDTQDNEAIFGSLTFSTRF
ncbi:MAG: lipid A deacylase LpxR family protein [Pseudomonadota bacterium]